MALRLIVGYGFVAHGIAKLTRGPMCLRAFAGDGRATANLMAWLTIVIELVGGVAVLVGAFVALVSIPLAAVLIVAMVKVHLAYGFSSIKLLAITPAGAQFGPPGYESQFAVSRVSRGSHSWAVRGPWRLKPSPVDVDDRQATIAADSSISIRSNVKRRQYVSVGNAVECGGRGDRCGGRSSAQPRQPGLTLAVIMTNDPTSNEIKVYDTSTNALVQTLSTGGAGGVAGNARGVKQYQGDLFAAVNNGSNTVALYRRVGDRLRFDRLVTTTSAPVSMDFGNDHMYVAGATTIDSFVLDHDSVGGLDGTATLELATGGVPPNGSTAQVGVVDEAHVLVTLKADPDPGTVDVVALDHGAVIGSSPTAVSAPVGSLAPFGFSVYPDGTALITLAHSGQHGLFRDGAFAAVIDSAGQAGPCWTTRVGKYVFTANTGSQTLSRLVGTGSHVFLDTAVAATVATGNPLDVDADGGVLAVIDHGAGQSHLSLFTYNAFGELTPRGAPITVSVPDANGVAIMVARSRADS